MSELIGVVTPDNTYNLAGQISGESALSGIVTAGAQYEAYSGSYSVTPSGSVQTLETDGKLMTDDVTVGAIPSDYIGTDIPRRSSISVSQDNNTIHVEDGYYENDIDTSMGACTVTGANVLIDSQGDATGSIIVGRGGYITSGSHAFYVEDVVTPRSSSDLTASGATVSVPYGYYSADASKSVASGSATTPATSITATPSISVSDSGLITATVSGGKSVTPTVSAGYVSSGTAGTVSVSGSATNQLSTQAGATITPTTSQQTVVASGKYTTGAVVVDAMPTGTAGTPTAAKGTVSNHSVSVTPSVTNTTGYITGSTINGTAVSVSASELVSGNKAITANGSNIDVTNYSTVSVSVSGGDMTVTDTTDAGGGTIRSIAGTITSGTATVTNPISKVILNNTTQMDTTTVTATAADVASGKTFLKADGTVGTGTASGGGGASNYVTGTFTTPSTGCTVETINISYSGNGYPINLLVHVEGGSCNNTAGTNAATWYNLVLRNSIGLIVYSKAVMTLAPTYSSSETNGENNAVAISWQKNSTSSSTSYTATQSRNASIYKQSDYEISGGSSFCMYFCGNGTTLKYITRGTNSSGQSASYGLVPNLVYRYHVIYSS